MMRLIVYLFILLMFFPVNNCSLSNSILNITKNSRKQIEKQITSVPIIGTVLKKPINYTLTFPELAKEYIKPAEEFEITTEDGYILKMYHIQGKKNKVLLISHGILSSSDDFLIRGNTSFVYMSAKHGFDMWLINLRGNRYTRKHVTLNADTDLAFWNYSLHELGIYDFKAALDFVLNKTGEKQISVVAHSTGNAAFFILMSEKPQYNDKIKVFVGLAPTIYVRHIGEIVNDVAKTGLILSPTLETLGVEEIAGYYSKTRKTIRKICLKGRSGYELCSRILKELIGFSRANIEPNFVPTILGHAPSGTNRRVLAHFSAMNRFNEFCQYDYGLLNIVKYHSIFPPVYNLKRTTTNVALFAAKGDLLVGIEDVMKLKEELPNVIHYQEISDETFSHLDYVWSNNAHIVLYPDVIDILQKFN